MMDDKERAKSLFSKGEACLDRREFEDAEQIFYETSRIVPNSIPVLNNLAIAQYEQGKISNAALTSQKVIEVDRSNIDAYLMLSTCQKDQSHYEEALNTCHKIIAIDPRNAQAHCNLGYTLNKIQKYQEAIASLDRAIALQPQFGDAFLNLGTALRNLERYDEALAAYEQALGSEPDFAEARFGRGNVFTDLKRYDEALVAYEKALALAPDLAEAWLGRGKVYNELKHHDEALVAFQKVQALKPDLAEAHFSEAFVRLLLGDMERGWEKYEYRWKTREYKRIKRDFFQPLWLGDSPLAKKTILLHAEQGLGDTLMACRYVPMVAALGASVILEVQPPLASLLKCLEGVSKLIARGDGIPGFDVHCPLMSLPLAFKTRLETIPAKVPYLTVPKEKIAQRRSRLGESGFKIGVAWAGSPGFVDDRDRSIQLKNILSVFSVCGARYFSIQKDLREGDQEILNAHPQIVQLGNEIKDFQDTAAIMMSLDLIISSDTFIVNLAGALASPVWVLLSFNPDWRWLLDRNDSPWYPTARLFRQTKTGQWETVVGEVCARLEKELVSRAIQ